MTDPVAVIGDIHGQFFDFVKLLQVISEDGQLKYLFLGDYVDRGPYSLEVIVVLMALKICSPPNVVLLRGNHETRQMASQHSFRQEVLTKKNNDQSIFDAFMDLFDCLPMAVVLNGKFFCVHGGLSPHINLVEDLNRLERKAEIPLSGPLCDLVWSDPVDREDGFVEDVWKHNNTRGVAYFFGVQATLPFLQRNKLQTVLRAHECVFEGYKEMRWGQRDPLVSTIFSAPNYTDYYQNLASVMVVKNGQTKYTQFLSSPAPFNLHRSQGLFDFTLTILSTKLIESLSHIYRRFYNEVQKEGSMTLEEIQGALLQVSQLEKLEQRAMAINDSLLNDSILVDENGQSLHTEGLEPKQKFFVAKLYDQSNESAFGPNFAGEKPSAETPFQVPPVTLPLHGIPLQPVQPPLPIYQTQPSLPIHQINPVRPVTIPSAVMNSGFYPYPLSHAPHIQPMTPETKAALINPAILITPPAAQRTKPQLTQESPEDFFKF